MKKLMFSLIVLVFSGSICFAQETAVILTKVKSGRKIVVKEGDAFVYLYKRPHMFQVYKKGRLVKAENGVIEFKKNKKSKSEFIDVDKLVIFGHRKWTSIVFSFITSVQSGPNGMGGGISPTFFLPGSTFHKKDLSRGKWILHTGTV